MASRINLADSLAGMSACYHHPSQKSVANCRECGKGLCRDCYDSYGAGMGAGKALCFDCTEELVRQNSAEIEWLKKQVKKERLWMIIGAILGFFVGAAGGPAGMFFGLFIGASLGTIFNGFMEYGWLVGGIMVVISPIMSIVRFVKRINQIKQADEILESDARILREMRDYFAYTLTMEKNAGFDLATLASQGSELYGNTYANAVMSKGESTAQAELRQGAVQIAANGEIIRSFDRRIAQRAA
jgi:hypothetical protein